MRWSMLLRSPMCKNPQILCLLQQMKHCHSGLAQHYCTGSIKHCESFIEISTKILPTSLKLNYIWLRDHCRCIECHNHTTNQRNIDLLSIPLNIRAQKCEVEGEKLFVTWPDGHRSEYDLSWLQKHSYENYMKCNCSKATFWDKSNVETVGIARISMDEYMDSNEGVSKIVKSLVKFGVAIVEKVPKTTRDTEKVVKKIAHVQRTIYGDMWELYNSLLHNDTAYTNQALGAHNDTTYFTEACGLQIFHCLHHDGEGGETLLVDGFRAADELQQAHPDVFERLCNFAIQSEYLEPGSHYLNVGPVLKLHPVTKQLEQIRFNLYDRAPLSAVPPEELTQFYKDLTVLASFIQNAKGEWWLKLQPGTVLLIDNWRTLHGRAAFTGRRFVCGCYIGRADFLSKARVLGIV